MNIRDSLTRIAKREYHRKWMLAHPEKAKEYRSRWDSANRMWKNELNRRYRLRHPESKRRERERAMVLHPERVHARKSVQQALRSGQLHKQPCEVCGCVRVHAHHEDYTRRLDVRWLCPQHHTDCHVEKNRAA